MPALEDFEKIKARHQAGFRVWASVLQVLDLGVQVPNNHILPKTCSKITITLNPSTPNPKAYISQNTPYILPYTQVPNYWVLGPSGLITVDGQILHDLISLMPWTYGDMVYWGYGLEFRGGDMNCRDIPKLQGLRYVQPLRLCGTGYPKCTCVLVAWVCY